MDPTSPEAQSELARRHKAAATTVLGLLVVTILLSVLAFLAKPYFTEKPNVVLILADNVGYGDLGPYGGELRGAPTPRIDELARQGMRLTQFLVEPACTPSRAALMTGQYSIRNGLSLIIIPGTPSTLPARAYTMGDMFHELGYATAIFGKWHLGSEPQSLPTAHGFDDLVTDAQGLAQLDGAGPLAGGHGDRHRGEGHAAVAEHVVRDLQQEGGVDPAREADHRRAVTGDDLAQAGMLFRGGHERGALRSP